MPPNPYNQDNAERDLFAQPRLRSRSSVASPRRKDAAEAVLMAPVSKDIAKRFYARARVEGITPCELLTKMLQEREK